MIHLVKKDSLLPGISFGVMNNKHINLFSGPMRTHSCRKMIISRSRAQEKSFIYHSINIEIFFCQNNRINCSTWDSPSVPKLWKCIIISSLKMVIFFIFHYLMELLTFLRFFEDIKKFFIVDSCCVLVKTQFFWNGQWYCRCDTKTHSEKYKSHFYEILKYFVK